MYKINRIGPWPIIDLSSSKVIRNSGATFTAAGSAALNVCLDTQNLGSKTEAFINGMYDGVLTFTSGQKLAFGVCLTPPQNVIQEENPIYLDISAASSSKGGLNVDPALFIGYIDTAGASIANGWDATHNLVSDYVLIPSQSQGYTGTNSWNTQVLLKDIVSGGGDIDKFLCIGIVWDNVSGAGASLSEETSYMISAAYATNAISTAWKGAY